MVCIGMRVPTAQARHSSAHMKAWWGDAQLSSADAGTAAPLREVPLHVESSPQNLPRRASKILRLIATCTRRHSPWRARDISSARSVIRGRTTAIGHRRMIIATPRAATCTLTNAIARSGPGNSRGSSVIRVCDFQRILRWPVNVSPSVSIQVQRRMLAS